MLHINYRCKWVKIHGDEYRESAGVILNVVQDLPTVGIIWDVYILNGDKVTFNVDQFSTSYEPHYWAYILESSTSSRIVCHSYLFIHTAIYICKSHVPDLSNVFVFCFSLCTCDHD